MPLNANQCPRCHIAIEFRDLGHCYLCRDLPEWKALVVKEIMRCARINMVALDVALFGDPLAKALSVDIGTRKVTEEDAAFTLQREQRV